MVAVLATPLAAQEKSYAEVRHLYEKAFLAIEDVDPAWKDVHYGELSWDLVGFGDPDLLARIPPKTRNELYRAEVTANLALAHARAGDCPAALEVNERAFSPSLVEDLGRPLQRERTRFALKTIVRTFARCGALERAEEAIASHDPGPEAAKPYLADADSTIAASLYLAGDLTEAERYLSRAIALAKPIKNEYRRSDALARVIANQVAMGRLDDALRTAKAIVATEERPKQSFNRYDGFRNWALQLIAFEFASQDQWEKAYGALDSQLEHKRYYRPAFVSLRLAYLQSLDRTDALKNLSELERVLVDEQSDHSLVLLALAVADLGEEPRAFAILDRLYEKHAKVYSKRDSETLRDPGLRRIALSPLDFILTTQVRMGRTQEVLDRLNSTLLRDVNARDLAGAWGSLIGHARLHGDAALLTQSEPVLENAHARFRVEFKIFEYLLDKRAFSEAERLIGSFFPMNLSGAYKRLAEERMGLSRVGRRYTRQRSF